MSTVSTSRSIMTRVEREERNVKQLMALQGSLDLILSESKAAGRKAKQAKAETALKLGYKIERLSRIS